MFVLDVAAQAIQGKMTMSMEFITSAIIAALLLLISLFYGMGMKTNKPKYRIGDRFNAWIITEVVLLEGTYTYIYSLHNLVSDGYLTVDESGLTEIFVAQST